MERHNTPEIEIKNAKRNGELMLPERRIERTKHESTFIEPSINSTRLSIMLKQMDDVDRLLTKLFTNFLMRRADSFLILRRKAVEGYDISFLITN